MLRFAPFLKSLGVCLGTAITYFERELCYLARVPKMLVRGWPVEVFLHLFTIF